MREATPDFAPTAAEREASTSRTGTSCARRSGDRDHRLAHARRTRSCRGTPPAELESEVRDSRRQLERSLERRSTPSPIRTATWIRLSEACVRKHYRVAVTTANGWVARGADAHRLPRLAGAASVLKLARGSTPRAGLACAARRRNAPARGTAWRRCRTPGRAAMIAWRSSTKKQAAAGTPAAATAALEHLQPRALLRRADARRQDDALAGAKKRCQLAAPSPAAATRSRCCWSRSRAACRARAARSRIGRMPGDRHDVAVGARDQLVDRERHLEHPQEQLPVAPLHVAPGVGRRFRHVGEGFPEQPARLPGASPGVERRARAPGRRTSAPRCCARARRRRRRSRPAAHLFVGDADQRVRQPGRDPGKHRDQRDRTAPS